MFKNFHLCHVSLIRSFIISTFFVVSLHADSISLIPNQGYPGDILQVTLYSDGVHFDDSYSQGYNIDINGDGLTASNINYINSGSLDFTLSISNDASAGFRDVIITTSLDEGALNHIQSNAFEVLSSYGCTDESACNYNYLANDDNGTCLYNDCTGQCDGSAQEDCFGVCNGLAEEDNCGVCEGDNECFNFEQVVIFEYTGSEQEYIMPLTSSNLTLEAWGAQGGGSNNGGMGGYARGDLTGPVAGETLYIFVGGRDGWNGGGTGYGSNGYYGGGASDLRINGGSMTDRIIVAGAGGGRINSYDGGGGGSGQCGDNYCGGGGGSGWDGYNGNDGGYYGGEGATCEHCGGGGGGGYQSGGFGAHAMYGADTFGQNGSFGYGGDGANSGCDTAGGGAGYYGGGGSTAGACGGGGGGGGSSWTGDLANSSFEGGVNEGHGLFKITYTDILPYIFSFEQQIIRGKTVEIPIRLTTESEIDGLTFAVEVSPNAGINSISENLSIEGIPDSDAIIIPTGEGTASVILSDLGSLSGEDIILANLLISIPEDTQNGDTYSLSFTSVSGSTANYDYVEMQDYLNTTLTVITEPPECHDIEDVHMLEESLETIPFSVLDLDGTEITVELIEAPNYVSIEYNSNEGSGNVVIYPGLGAESGLVVIEATNSELVPESCIDSFMVYINHYPVLSPNDTVYLQEGESTSFDVSLTDSDGDNMSLALQSAPEYVNYTPYDDVSGQIEIVTSIGDESGDVVFTIEDDGSPPVSTTSGFTVIINHNPMILGLEDFHVPENDVLDTMITFYDFDGDELSFEIVDSLSYLSYTVVGNNEGLALTIAPGSDDVDGTFTIAIADPGGMSVEQSVLVNVYETFFVGDVRPWQDDITGDGDEDDAGEFGDDMVVAPDVINALKVSTGAEVISDSSSNLYDAFDSCPIDNDANGDEDVYDESERGGDGNIYVNDVEVSLLRATGVEMNVRRVDNNYPYSTRFSDRDDSHLEPTDMLVLGSVEAYPGGIAQIPVTLVRGESESELTGLVSGFAVTHGSGLELLDSLEFIEAVECMKIDVPTGNNFLSLLMIDIDEQTPKSELLLGYIAFTVPDNATNGMVFTIHSQNTSGSTIDYNTILFNEGTAATVTAQATVQVQQEILTGTGWNWFSFNVEADDNSLANLLDPLEDEALFIASQSSGVANYYAGYGWGGSLDELDPTQMYKLQMANPELLTITGIPVDVESTPIALIEGWNWIGYLPQNSGDIISALENISDNALFIASQSDGVSNYYEGYGWGGTLNTLEPGNGYLLEMSAEDELIYPEFDGLVRQALNKQEVTLNTSIVDWDFNFADYEFIGTITASIENQEDYEGDIVGVFVDEKCRGLAERMYFPFNDSYMYIVQVYSNLEEGEELTFKYYDSVNDKVIEYTEDLAFENLMNVGDGFNTFSLQRIMPEKFYLDTAYPNPFNPITTLGFSIPVESEVRLSIYNLQGREVASLVNGNMQPGYHSVKWDANNHSSGIYFVKMIAGEYVSNQKLMLVK